MLVINLWTVTAAAVRTVFQTNWVNTMTVIVGWLHIYQI